MVKKNEQPNPTERGTSQSENTPLNHPESSEVNETTEFETTNHRLAFIMHLVFMIILPYSFSSFDLLSIAVI